jgi:exopolysaccharide biosynthesis polyprenyl glycosylphosphotransferase
MQFFSDNLLTVMIGLAASVGMLAVYRRGLMFGRREQPSVTHAHAYAGTSTKSLPAPERREHEPEENDPVRREDAAESSVFVDRRAAHDTDAGKRRVLVVGAGSVGRTLARGLSASGKYFIVGFVDDGSDDSHHAQMRGDWRVLGKRHETPDLVKKYQVDEVVLAYAPTWQHQLAEELAANYPEVTLRVVPSPYDALMRMYEVECYSDIALIRLAFGTRGFHDITKRMFDIVAAILGLILLSPILLVSALLIKLSSPGGVIFSQRRIGRGGKEFTLHKFRTMVPNAEAKTGPILAKGTQDSRLTPIGKWLRRFRIDELPQLWNVLKGDMSIVGPRPERPHFVQQFMKKTPTYAQRHQVRPGITGLAQICGGYHTDARDKLRFDLIYVSHYSVWLDICLLLRTLFVVVDPKRGTHG